MAGLLALLMMTNVLIVSTIARRAGTVLTWRGAVLPLLIALILALLELGALANVRIGLTSVIATAANTPPDLPLVPGLKIGRDVHRNPGRRAGDAYADERAHGRAGHRGGRRALLRRRTLIVLLLGGVNALVWK